MASLKNFLFDYRLYIIFTLSFVGLLFNIQASGVYFSVTNSLILISCGFVLASIYNQRKMKKQSIAYDVADTNIISVNKAKSEFISRMSHEIRTPMSAVTGLIQVLLNTKLDARQKECLSVLQTSSETLMTLINNLLEIKKAESQQDGIEAAPFKMTANAQTQSILLVEDYEANILVATLMFKSFGFEYEVARNGQQASEMFAAGKYSIILMDVEMPIMDGYETTRFIRAKEKARHFPPTPIIAMTAHALQGDREKCIDAGMDDYIAKPLTPEVLQALLAKYLNSNNKKSAA